MNEVAIKNSNKSYMLVDSSKFGVATHIIYTDVKSLHAVVTDEGVDPGVLEEMRKYGIKTIIAGK